MYRLSHRLIVGVAWMCGVALLSGTALLADDDVDPKLNKQAADTVIKLAGSLDAKDLGKQAEAAAKANDIENVMRQFKPRNKGGLGVGAKAPPPGVKDSIELAVIDFGTKKAPNAADLKQYQDDFVKLAQQTQAIGEIASYYPPPKPKAGTKPANWKTYNDEMKAAAKELGDAAKAGNAPKFKEAATRLNAACNNCHTDFRD